MTEEYKCAEFLEREAESIEKIKATRERILRAHKELKFIQQPLFCLFYEKDHEGNVVERCSRLQGLTEASLRLAIQDNALTPIHEDDLGIVVRLNSGFSRYNLFYPEQFS